METWREIVAELKTEPLSKEGAKPWLHYLADRIENACKTLEDLLIVEQKENAKLRRALEPVMKCGEIEFFNNTKTNMFYDGNELADAKADGYKVITDHGGSRRVAIECKYIGLANDIAFVLNSVRDAQAIMKEGVE